MDKYLESQLTKDDVDIIIGGQKRKITSYNYLRKIEQGKPGVAGISVLQYQSILFNNLGYENCPSTLTWINNTPLENATRDAVLDYYPSKHKLTINRNGMYLNDLIEVINNWVIGKLEKGQILDIRQSFQLPNIMEVKYCLDNGIAIKRSKMFTANTVFWRSSDIWKRRARELAIDEEYRSNCIRRLEEYSKQIFVTNPCPIFASMIMNPNIFFLALKNAEMEACKEVNDSYSGYTALRKDYDVVLKFVPILQKKIDNIADIYYKKGAFGFVEQIVRVDNNLAKTAMSAKLVDNSISKMDALERKNFIDNVEWDSKTKSYVFSYLSRKSIPEFLSKPEIQQDENGNNVETFNSQYYPTLRRVYFTLLSIEENFPDLIDPKNKFIISKPFYRNANEFALYHKASNTYFLVLNDYTTFSCSPQEAVEQYKKMYNQTVLLDPEEMGDNLDSPKVVDTNAEAMSNPELIVQNIQQNMIDPALQAMSQAIPMVIPTPTQQTTMINNTIVPTLQDKQEETYGLDVNKFVEQ